MATNTENLNLIKPSGTDKIRIAQINQNMDILDEKIGPVGSSSLQDQMNLLSSKFTTISSGSLHDILKTGMYYLTAAVTDKPTAAGGYYSVTVFSNDLLVGMFCSLDGNIFNIRLANNTWTYQQTPSFRVVEGTQTTGATGNIALGEQGTNKHFVIAATALNVNAFVRPWRTTTNQGWYLTVVDPNTGAPITNTSINYRYMAIDLY